MGEDSRYHIVDHQTGKKMTDKGYSHAQRNKARNKAESMNMEYGAHRYSAQPHDLMREHPLYGAKPEE